MNDINLGNILQSLITIGMVSLFGVVWKLSNEVSLLSYQVGQLTAGVDDRYRGVDAERDWELQKNINSAVQDRLDAQSVILTRHQQILDRHEVKIDHLSSP